MLEALHGIEPDKRGAGVALAAFLAREQGDTDSAHQPRVGRTRDGFAQILLECAQHRVVSERAALDDDFVAQTVEI